MTTKFGLRGIAGAILVCGAFAMAGTAYAKPVVASTKSPPEITEAYAKAQILGDNYTNITDLKRTSEGWTANADESGKPVSLLVTDMGDVQKP